MVTEGLYAVGPHMFTNILAALVTFVVARRDTLSLVLVTVLTLGTVWWAPPRARFYALWMLVALLPFAGFRGGMSSRYLYLSAVGVSGLLAELTSSVRLAFARWPRAGHAAWLVLLLALAGRYSLFAVKNIRTWEHVSAPYAEFAARVQARHGSAPAGVRLEVPPPPAAVPAHMVRPLLQWTYDDMDVDPVIAER